ncbi:MAG: hypothetical protein K8U57_27290 [Planctomycetes bacterium]|nr:hypothetical protein [Planctomycetota bacterium]
MSDDIPTLAEANAINSEWTKDYALRKASGDTLHDILSGSPAREDLLKKVRHDFHTLGEQLVPGIQVLLEAHNVPAEVRQAVGEYLGDVLKGLDGVGREVQKLAAVPGAEQAGYSAMHEGKEHDGLER